MKFIKLESRGGNYLVVASNVAWLRTAENEQTTVGMVGGLPLLVVGSVEEVAAKIMAGLAGGDDETAAAPEPAPVADSAPPPAAQPVVEAPAPAPAPAPPEPDPLPVSAAPPPVPQPDPDPIPHVPRAQAPVAATPARPRSGSARSASMWERPAAAAAPQSLQIKPSSQRMMGQLE